MHAFNRIRGLSVLAIIVLLVSVVSAQKPIDQEQDRISPAP
jgi:hypothetical protein